MNHQEMLAREYELLAQISELNRRLDFLPAVETLERGSELLSYVLRQGERLRCCNAELFEVQQLINAEYGLPYVQV